MIVVNTDFITGKNIETIGLVSGSMIQTKHAGKDIAAGFKSFIGGELKGYTKMLEESREMATQRMIEQAEKFGADAVINVRITSAEILQGASESLVYGTAVKFV